jgi:hypothetical protein
MAKKAAKKEYSAFNLLDDDFDIVAQTRESLADMCAKNKNKNAVRTVDHNVFDGPGIPIKHFALQIFFGSTKLQSKKVYEVIAKEACAKTSLAFMIAGYGMSANIPTIYVETESKLMHIDRITRCLHTDKATARKMASRINIVEADSLDEMWNNVQYEIKALRSLNKVIVPMDTPILVILDSFSKLMSLDEAKGRSAYGDNQDAAALKKFKETGDATNLGHSDFAHIWCRELPSWLRQNNVIFWINSHQNDKIDMTGMITPAMMASLQKTAKVKIGGNAINQNAAAQITVNKKGLYSKSVGGENVQLGHILEAVAVKNSYGSDYNKMQYNLITRHMSDTDDWQEPVFDFDTDLAKYLATNGYLGTTADGGKYSSKELDAVRLSPKEFCDMLHNNHEAMAKLGKQLNIIGYGG